MIQPSARGSKRRAKRPLARTTRQRVARARAHALALLTLAASTTAAAQATPTPFGIEESALGVPLVSVFGKLYFGISWRAYEHDPSVSSLGDRGRTQIVEANDALRKLAINASRGGFSAQPESTPRDGSPCAHNFLLLSENALRKVVRIRDAALFAGSDDHAESAGHVLSMIASARLHQLDPEAYLRDIIRVLPFWPRDRYLQLAPKYWASTRLSLNATQLASPVGIVDVPPALPR